MKKFRHNCNDGTLPIDEILRRCRQYVDFVGISGHAYNTPDCLEAQYAEILKAREDEINLQYSSAKQAESEAMKSKQQYEEALSTAAAEADGIIKDAAEKAKRRSDTIIDDANEKAERILRQAEQDAALERSKATDSIKREIVEVSSALSAKLIEREINPDDHKALIDSFIEEIGEDNE